MMHPELEKLVRDAWALVAAEMGAKFLELSWVKGPQDQAACDNSDEEMPLAA
jgi:hypothetical protein